MSAADISALLIALREGVEMALIVGIVLAYLGNIGARTAQRWVWLGVGAAALVSVGFLGILNLLEREFVGAVEQIYEGTAMLLAAAFLTWMIFWMLQRSRYIRSELQSGVAEVLARGGAAWGLFALAFFTVVREGVETALLLFAAPGQGKLLGAVIGFAAAIGIGVLIYAYGRRIDLRTFFRVTGILLVIFAAGLLTHGVHEFVEAGLAGGPTVFDLSATLPDDEGLGSILRALLGYSADPTWLEVAVYVAYFVVVWALSKTKLIGRMVPRVTEARPSV
ncbi:MAG TPA: FTR1 family protein [Candidatus Acidoferrales bacterium]|nr:FTR1 family protein [Candidatus Acidoferrales bacterium]